MPHFPRAPCSVVGAGGDGASGGRPHARTQSPELKRVLEQWLPAGPVTIGLTAGASTPNNKIGETIERIAATRGITLAESLG